MERTPLFSVEAEMSVISAMLNSSETASEIMDLLSGTEFTRPAHTVIFEAAKDVSFKKGRVVDLISIKDRLSESGNLEAVGGSAGLVELSSYRFKGKGTWEDHLGIVVDKHKLRLLETAAAAVEGIIHDPDMATADEKIEAALSAISQIETTKSETIQSSVRDIAKELFARIDDSIAGNKVEEVGFSTGFPAIDELLGGGMRPQTQMMVGARPGMGKTAFVTELAIAAGRQGKVVHVQSIEMNKIQLGRRMMARLAKVDIRQIEKVEDQKLYSTLADAAEEMYGLPIEINDDSDMTLSKLIANVRKTRRKYGRVDLVIVDYWQLMRYEGKSNASRADQLKLIADGIRNMIAKPFKAKTVVLAQVKQEVDNRDDKRPNANDLKDSAGGEEAADEVVMLYRQEFYDAKKEARAERSPSSAEVLIRKNRNGPLGKVELGWMGPQTRFTNT